ncbi:hypothetical protein [Archaeoglobus veneficus]|uniref:Capsid protein VP2 n=1 Tax=Archaeoglobus veneficus (strain DSM 11195 / SNP6) TaxID=693661 RepID=F2KR58_ARCVS|nr:hypothetical protein [Archaeoglobus veneficus]AEA46695.1 hypothetical protein Arcve_0675 [Archaeoglobus veneficus SNP6]
MGKGRNKKWIQKAIKRPGRVERYIKRVYGDKAFNKDGTIKMKYLNMAEKRAEKKGNDSLADAIRLAKTLKRLSRKRKKGRRNRK